MNTKKFLALIMSMALGVSAMLCSAAAPVSAAQTGTSVAAAAETPVVTTTTAPVNKGDLDQGYPKTGTRAVSVDIVDSATGYSVYGDVNVTLTLLTGDDFNSSDENEGTEIAVWNISDELSQPRVVNVPYTLYSEDTSLFLAVELDGFPENYKSIYTTTLFIFEPLSDEPCNYEVSLTRIYYTTTAAPLDYCEGCGKHLDEGEGVRTVLGMYLCSDCVAAGMGGTTTAPYSTTLPTATTTTTHGGGTGTTTAWTGTTTTTDDIGCVSSLETQTTLAPQDYCDSCGADIPEGEGVRTPLGLYICKNCKNAGAGGTTPPAFTATTTTVTTLNTTSTPQNKICDGCGYGAFEYNGTYTEDGLFYCYQCAEDILGGTTTATTTTVTTTTTLIACYNTLLKYDDSEMAVGETRAIYFYNAYSGVGADPFIGEASDNISYTYVEGTNVIYITALAAGEAKLYIREGTCAFGAYVHINVASSQFTGTTTTPTTTTTAWTGTTTISTTPVMAEVSGAVEAIDLSGEIRGTVTIDGLQYILLSHAIRAFAEAGVEVGDYVTFMGGFKADTGTYTIEGITNLVVYEGGTSDCIPNEYGDVDFSGDVGISDVVLVMCYAANSEKYPLDALAIEMADVYQQGDGVGAADALSIQKYIAQEITSLPES